MKQLLVIVLLAVSTTVYATNWQMVTDSTDATRLLVDVDTVKFEKYTRADKTVSARVYAIMEFLSDSEILFTAVIDTEDCIVREAGPLVNIYADGTNSTFFWAMRGTKMYDAQGQWLCGYVKGVLKQTQKQKPKSKKTYM